MLGLDLVFFQVGLELVAHGSNIVKEERQTRISVCAVLLTGREKTKVIAVFAVPCKVSLTIGMALSLDIKDLLVRVLPKKIQLVWRTQPKRSVQLSDEAIGPKKKSNPMSQLNQNVHSIHRVVNGIHDRLTDL